MNYEEWLRADDFAVFPEDLPKEEWMLWGRRLTSCINKANFKRMVWIVAADRYGASLDEIAVVLKLKRRSVIGLRWEGPTILHLIKERPEFKMLPYCAFRVVVTPRVPMEVKIQALDTMIKRKMSVNGLNLMVVEWLKKHGGGGRATWGGKAKTEIRVTEENWRRLCAIAHHHEYNSPNAFLDNWIEGEWRRLFDEMPISKRVLTDSEKAARVRHHEEMRQARAVRHVGQRFVPEKEHKEPSLT